jgi:hypothetical protein
MMADKRIEYAAPPFKDLHRSKIRYAMPATPVVARTAILTAVFR